MSFENHLHLDSFTAIVIVIVLNIIILSAIIIIISLLREV